MPKLVLAWIWNGKRLGEVAADIFSVLTKTLRDRFDACVWEAGAEWVKIL